MSIRFSIFRISADPVTILETDIALFFELIGTRCCHIGVQ